MDWSVHRVTMMDVLQNAPSWLLRPLPSNAAVDEKVNAEITKLATELPKTLSKLTRELDKIKYYREYDAAVNLASAYVWRMIDDLFTTPEPNHRLALLYFAKNHMVEAAQARVCRRLVKDPSMVVRRAAQRMVETSHFREVALPEEPDGAWDSSGWMRGTDSPLTRHKAGRRVREQLGVPDLTNIAKLRDLLGIKSTRQLGYFLLASDRKDGPYTKFTIPKRHGGTRDICAPKSQLRWVQRQILDQILMRVPNHPAAHGFVPGRSIVTNAEPHLGAKLILKFDLTDFFPTIHYFRVVGLFASLGYHAGTGRFTSQDKSREVAPTLARLCCYTPDPTEWASAVLPQGAPTSPAISNLVSRRLDARLQGLAERNNGVYTRYADDLTFSFKEPDSLELGRFRWWVDQVCHQEGFFINHKKFHVIRAAQRQVVTGIVVNQELHVPRKERRRFRAILHNCRQHGVESQSRGHARFREYLRGYASYIHMVQPEEGAELLQEVESLLGPESTE